MRLENCDNFNVLAAFPLTPFGGYLEKGYHTRLIHDSDLKTNDRITVCVSFPTRLNFFEFSCSIFPSLGPNVPPEVNFRFFHDLDISTFMSP